MPARGVLVRLEAVVSERIDSALLGYITPDEGDYSITPPLPDGLEPIWSKITGRFVLTGTPTSAHSGIHFITGNESGSGFTVHIEVRSAALPSPTVTVAPTVTRRAGARHGAFSIATVNDLASPLLLDDFIISGAAALGLKMSVSGAQLRLSGFIPAYLPAGDYRLWVRPSLVLQRHLVEIGSEESLSFEYTLTVTASAATPGTPDDIPEPYWEGNPGTVRFAHGVRIPEANPVFVGYMRQVDDLWVFINAVNGIPPGLTFNLDKTNGAVSFHGRPRSSGSFLTEIRFWAPAGSEIVTETIKVEVAEPIEYELPNAPPTISVTEQDTFVDAEVPLSLDTFRVRDEDDVPLVTIAGLPPGLTFDGGTITGEIPTLARRGTYSVTCTATDTINPVVRANARIHVRGNVPSVPPPVHTNVATDFSLQQNVSGSLRRLLAVTGETLNEVTGLPPDLRWEKRGNNIVLLGRVQVEAEARAYNVTVTSENLGGQAVSDIVITVTGSTPPPAEDTRGVTVLSEVFNFVQGQRVSERVFDFTVPITTEGLPEGLNVVGGYISGLVVSAPGSYVVNVFNRDAFVTDSFTIKVARPERDAPIILTKPFEVFATLYQAPLVLDSRRQPFTLPTDELAGRRVRTDETVTSWEFGQPSAPPAAEASFTAVVNGRPRWLFPPSPRNIHQWLISPASVPINHHNKFVRFRLRAVRTEESRDDDGNRVITRFTDEADVNVFVIGPVPKPIPTVQAVRFLEGVTADEDMQGPLREERTLALDLSVPDDADAYGMYIDNISIDRTFTRGGSGAVEFLNTPFIWLDYETEEDGRHKLVGAQYRVQYRLVGGSPFSDYNYRVRVSGNSIPQDYPSGVDLPPISVTPGFQPTRLDFSNSQTDVRANRMYLRTREAFRLLPGDLANDRSIFYRVSSGDVIPVDPTLVTPEPFAKFGSDSDYIPPTPQPPPNPPTPAVPATQVWLTFNANPTLQNVGRYNVPVTITRSIEKRTTADGVLITNRPDQPSTWDHHARTIQTLRVASQTPAPIVEGFRGVYRIATNEFWESEPFLASSAINDPIEISAPFSPEGFEVSESEDGFRLNWTPTHEQAGTHEIEIHVTANPRVEEVPTSTRILPPTITVTSTRGHITQVENPSSVKAFGDKFVVGPPFHNWQSLEYGLRGSHVVPPRAILFALPIDLQPNDLWRELEPGRVVFLNLFNVMDRPSRFIVDRVGIQDAGYGNAYKNIWLTEQRVEPEGWYQGTGAGSGADREWFDFDTLFVSNRKVELSEYVTDKFLEATPAIREVLRVKIEDDGSAQVTIGGNPVPFFPNSDIQMRVGDSYVTSGPATITPGGISWSGTTEVPAFSDTESIAIEGTPSAEVPWIVAQQADSEAIFEAGIQFNGRKETNPGVLSGSFLVQRHVNTLVAYDEETGDLWNAETGVRIGQTITGQTAVTVARLEGKRRPSLLLRGSEDYEVLL